MRVAFQQAIYSVALPDGTTIVERNGAIESSTDGRIPRGDILALQATRYKGVLYLAGQGHDDGFCWFWTGAQGWKSLGQSYGVRPCAFGSDSLYWAYSGDSIRRLHLDTGEITTIVVGGGVGSQGIRFVEGDRIWRGDDTLFDGAVHEWISRGDVRVGQGHAGGCLVNGRLLEPGDCQFITFERNGDKLAIAIVKFLEGQSVLHFLTRAEVDLLPNQPQPEPQPEPKPVPKPEPQPEPEPPMDGITDAQFDILQAVRAKYDATLNEEQGGAYINECCYAAGLGMQRKDSGTASIQPQTGIRIWNGVRFIRDGKHYGQDVFAAASIGKFQPTRGEVGPADPDTYVAPVQPEHSEPKPDPVPDPVPQSEIEKLNARIDDLQSKTVEALVNLSQRYTELLTKIEVLEHQTVTIPKLRVKGRTKQNLYHSHELDLEVVPE